MKVRYRYRFYPTEEQGSHLARTFGCARFVYNWALRLRTDSYEGGKTINYNASSAALTRLKKEPEYAWLNEVSCVPLQQSLRHLQTSFKNFFDKRSKYPKFKRKSGRQSAEYTRSAFKYRDGVLSVSKLGKLKVRWSRSFNSQPTTVTIAKDCAGRYFVTLCLDEIFNSYPKTQKAVGIDLGINRLATLSNGEHVPNPRYLNRHLKQLARAQRVLSRRKKGSNRRERARLRVAKIQVRIADIRADYLHKVTTDLVRRFDTICIEDLNVHRMTKNKCLARSLSDASFGTVALLLDYKCARYGKELKKVDRFFPSSKRCHVCGHIKESLSLSMREWNCPECGSLHDRDENAAINILTAGHAAQGGHVRRTGAKAPGRYVRGTVNQPVEH